MNWWKLIGFAVITTTIVASSNLFLVSGEDSISIKDLETKTTGTQEEILVRKVEFDFDESEEENVKIEFNTKVRYKNPTVTIKDDTGAVYEAEILEKDWDDLELFVEGLSQNNTYTIEIQGIKKRNAEKFGTLKIEAQTQKQIKEQKFYENDFTATSSGMEKSISIEEIEVEWNQNGKSFISIDFMTKVAYEKPTITIKQVNKTSDTVVIEEKDQDDLELITSALKAGETYTIIIDGIKPKQTKQAGTLTIEMTIKEEDSSDAKTDSSATTKARLKEAEYDREDEELELKFDKKIVTAKDCSVVITDRFGKQHKLSILEIEEDEMKLDASEIELGTSFKYTISGVKTTKETSYGTLTGKIALELD